MPFNPTLGLLEHCAPEKFDAERAAFNPTLGLLELSLSVYKKKKAERFQAHSGAIGTIIEIFVKRNF